MSCCHGCLVHLLNIEVVLMEEEVKTLERDLNFIKEGKADDPIVL